MTPKGRVVTFYSYKGGVGRSSLVASVAVTLASWGKKVICIDWDLEAPGLSIYFEPYIDPVKTGLLDLTEDIQVKSSISWRDYVAAARLPQGGKLDLIPAGGNQNYSDRVQALSWDDLFDKHKFGQYLELMRRDLKEEYDFVLIDSRTGLSDVGGICAVQLPDLLIVLVTTNDQSISGTADIARRIPIARDSLTFDRLALPIIPILSKFDAREERELGHRWLGRTAERLGALYMPWLPVGHEVIDVLERTTIPYVSSWNFGERIPPLEERSSNPESVNWAIDNLSALMINGLADVAGLISDRDSFVRKARTQTATLAVAYDVFISAGKHNNPKMKKLASVLSDDGFLAFTDDLIPEGSEWADQVEVALRASSHLVLLVDESLSKPQEVELEIFLAATVRREIDSHVALILTRDQFRQSLRGMSRFRQIDWTTGRRAAAAVEDALSLRGRGDVTQWQSVLSERDRTLGSDHPAVFSTRTNLARAYLEADRPGEAVRLLEPTFARQAQVLGPDDSAITDSAVCLARAYLETGRPEEAIELLRRSVDGDGQLLDPDDPVLLNTLVNLARAYLETGRPEEAIELLRHSLDGGAQTLGPDDPVLLATAANLAQAYLETGQPDQAIGVLRLTLDRQARELTPDDPAIVTTRTALAWAYLETSHFEKAIDMLEPSLDRQLQLLEPDDPVLLTTAANLARAYLGTGHLDQAIQLLEPTLDRQVQVLGPDDPVLLATAANLAQAYLENGHPEHAIQLLEPTLDRQAQTLGPHDPVLLATVTTLAQAYLETGHPDQAIDALQPTLDRQAQTLGPNDPAFLATAATLARAYLEAGRPEQAIELLRHSPGGGVQTLEPDDPVLLATVTTLAKAYLETGHPDQAIDALQPTLDRQAQTLGPNDPAFLATAATLARAYLETGHPEQAIQLSEQIGPAQIGVLLEQLEAQDVAMRQTAVAALVGRHEPTVTQALQERLEDPAPAVRQAAVAALAGRHEPTVTQALQERLEDPAPAVRQAAVAALAGRHEPSQPETPRRHGSDKKAMDDPGC